MISESVASRNWKVAEETSRLPSKISYLEDDESTVGLLGYIPHAILNPETGISGEEVATSFEILHMKNKRLYGPRKRKNHLRTYRIIFSVSIAVLFSFIFMACFAWLIFLREQNFQLLVILTVSIVFMIMLNVILLAMRKRMRKP